MSHYEIVHNDVIEWAKTYTGPKMMACLADPPYHLVSTVKRFGPPNSKPPKGGVYKRTSAGFMGSRWDGGDIAFDPATWAALAQHLYPGAFIMAFAGSRGYHRMACAMEDAGLIIHPAMGWLTLSGFPKATRIDTQIDKAAGAEQEILGPSPATRPNAKNHKVIARGAFNGNPMLTAPATPLARDWAGHRYGLQALKPAFEFIAVAQVPYEGRPVDSIVSSGAGSLWIDGGRIAAAEPIASHRNTARNEIYGKFNEAYQPGDSGKYTHTNGRWPSNFLLQHSPLCNGDCHPDCPVRLFDEQAGETSSDSHQRHNSANQGSVAKGREYNHTTIGYDDSGPASRMFYQASWQYEVAEQLANAEPVRYEPKVSGAERDAGLDGFEVGPAGIGDNRPGGDFNQRLKPPGRENIQPVKARNNHPTLKPVSLTKYLATLLLPPAAYAPRRCLIPFCGVGSEVAGAILAGWEEVIGIEREANYVKIAEARLRWWSQWPGWGQTDVDAILAAAKEKDDRQLSLFSEAA